MQQLLSEISIPCTFTLANHPPCFPQQLPGRSSPTPAQPPWLPAHSPASRSCPAATPSHSSTTAHKSLISTAFMLQPVETEPAKPLSSTAERWEALEHMAFLGPWLLEVLVHHGPPVHLTESLFSISICRKTF